MPAPRLEIDLDAVEHNARTLVERLAGKGIRVTGVCKAALGSIGVAAAMLRGGVHGLGDSRVQNLEALDASGVDATFTLIRSPMLSQVDRVVRVATVSLNTEPVVLSALSAAACAAGVEHGVLLMVELGDLREGLAVDDVAAAAAVVRGLPGLRLDGLGTNLACQCGVVPDQDKMDELSALVERIEVDGRHSMAIVSGGNSANLGWAFGTDDVGRIDDLRLGEAILLGTDPLDRVPVPGLRTDAFVLVGEVIEARAKPAQPWGALAQAAFGEQPPRTGSGLIAQVIVALGRQDVDPDGLTPPAGMVVLGTSSDHLVLDVGDHDVSVGDEITFGVNYSALVRAMTSPFVSRAESVGPPAPSRRRAESIVARS